MPARPPHPTGLPAGDADASCGACAWRYEQRGAARCRHAELRRLDLAWPACERYEPALDCQACGACCRAAYHSVEVAPRDPPPAPEHIRRQVLRADRRFMLFAAADVAVCLLGIAWVVWYLSTHDGPTAFMLGFIMMAFLGYSLDFAFAIRRGVWRAADGSTEAWLALLAERCARRRRYVRVGWLMLFAMTLAIALLVLVLWLWFPGESANLERRGWWLIPFFAAFYLAHWAFARRYLADAAEQERRIAAWRAELGAPLG